MTQKIYGMFSKDMWADVYPHMHGPGYTNLVDRLVLDDELGIYESTGHVLYRFVNGVKTKLGFIPAGKWSTIVDVLKAIEWIKPFE